MAMQLIPSHWVVRRSTPFFTRQNVPQALLTHHNTSAGEFATSPPRYWHRVELSEDARFNIHFWAEQGLSDQPLFHSRKA
ncbi:DUF1971 domain-containing protein [Aeromonas taiwanensis]